MNIFERMVVATFKAIDVWFSFVMGERAIDLQERLRYSNDDLGEDYDPPNSLEGP